LQRQRCWGKIGSVMTRKCDVHGRSQPDAVSAYICVAVPCVGRRARTARWHRPLWSLYVMDSIPSTWSFIGAYVPFYFFKPSILAKCNFLNVLSAIPLVCDGKIECRKNLSKRFNKDQVLYITCNWLEKDRENCVRYISSLATKTLSIKWLKCNLKEFNLKYITWNTITYVYPIVMCILKDGRWCIIDWRMSRCSLFLSRFDISHLHMCVTWSYAIYKIGSAHTLLARSFADLIWESARFVQIIIPINYTCLVLFLSSSIIVHKN